MNRLPTRAQLLTRTQAAEYLGCDRRTLEQWERSGKGPSVIRLPSGQPAYTIADLDAFIARHRVQGEAA
jgi:hypothetical protein